MEEGMEEQMEEEVDMIRKHLQGVKGRKEE